MSHFPPDCWTDQDRKETCDQLDRCVEHAADQVRGVKSNTFYLFERHFVLYVSLLKRERRVRCGTARLDGDTIIVSATLNDSDGSLYFRRLSLSKLMTQQSTLSPVAPVIKSSTPTFSAMSSTITMVSTSSPMMPSLAFYNNQQAAEYEAMNNRITISFNDLDSAGKRIKIKLTPEESTMTPTEAVKISSLIAFMGVVRPLGFSVFKYIDSNHLGRHFSFEAA